MTQKLVARWYDSLVLLGLCGLVFGGSAPIQAADSTQEVRPAPVLTPALFPAVPASNPVTSPVTADAVPAIGSVAANAITPATAAVHRPVSVSTVAIHLPTLAPGTVAIHLPTPVSSPPPIKIGFEDWIGVSNLQSLHHYSDGMWVGSNTASPSVGYLSYDDRKGSTAHLSIGIGADYTSAGITVQQPVEAWWQRPIGKARLTVGKYYVPFAQQEWEYETKPGAMLQWSRGADAWTVSTNYERSMKTANTYVRLVHTVSSTVALGFSAGAGKGFSFGSSLDRGLGVDGTVSWKNLQFVGEFDRMQGPSSHQFDFGFGKLSYNGPSPWKPFVGIYSWGDNDGTFGRYQSGVVGLGYRLTSNITLEGGYAPNAQEAGKPASWLQVHTTWEK